MDIYDANGFFDRIFFLTEVKILVVQYDRHEAFQVGSIGKMCRDRFAHSKGKITVVEAPFIKERNIAEVRRATLNKREWCPRQYPALSVAVAPSIHWDRKSELTQICIGVSIIARSR